MCEFHTTKSQSFEFFSSRAFIFFGKASSITMHSCIKTNLAIFKGTVCQLKYRVFLIMARSVLSSYLIS